MGTPRLAGDRHSRRHVQSWKRIDVRKDKGKKTDPWLGIAEAEAYVAREAIMSSKVGSWTDRKHPRKESLQYTVKISRRKGNPTLQNEMQPFLQSFFGC